MSIQFCFSSNNITRKLALLMCLGTMGMANAIINGDFETGDFTGWTQFGDGSFSGVDPGIPHTGTYGAFFGPLSPGGIEQAIIGNVGDECTVEFWLANTSAATPHSARVTLDGQNILSLSNTSAFDYTHFSGTVTLTNNNPMLRFEFVHVPSYWFLDDVSVSCVPEPASMAAMGIGLAAIVAKRRRKVKA